MSIVRLIPITLLALLFALPAAAQETARPVTPQDLADPDGVFVEINGISVYYREAGPQDGPAVLLLHGFLGSTSNWDTVLPVLAEAGYRAIAFDRPPFGLSDKNPDLDYSLQAMGDLTVALMDELGIESATLIGHSAGGPVIARVALDHPERVEKLVVVAGAIGLEAEMGAQTDDNAVAGAFGFMRNVNPESPLARAALRAFFNSASARRMLEQSYGDPARVTTMDVERNGRYTQIPGWEAGLLAFVRDSVEGDGVFALDELKTVSAPVLLLWGEADRIVPVSVGERLRGLFPNHQWISYPGVGHIPQLEAAEAFNADLLAFLGKPG